MISIRKLSLLGVISLVLVSCGTQKYLPKNYMERKAASFKHTEYVIPEIKIQEDDLLTIQIYSESTEPEKTDLIFNQPPVTGLIGQQLSNRVLGFLVDKHGFIELPRIGKVHAAGLTKMQLEEEIKKRLVSPVKLLTNPSVIVRFQNFRIVVLGAVAREGTVNVPGEKISILEAIGLAGGINEFGHKENVEVIREHEGKRETGVIDLSSDSLFLSPYYYLQQNDVVLIKSNFRRVRDADLANSSRTISLIIAITSLAATMYNIFSK